MQSGRGKRDRTLKSGFMAIGALLMASCAAETAESPRSTGEQPESQAAQIIFEKAYSETGSIRVYRGASGQLGMGVVGGKDDDLGAIRQHLAPSIVQIHRNLFPGVPVPDMLNRLDRELAIAQVEASDIPAAPLLAAPQESEDEGSFLATACRRFLVNSGSGVMFPIECKYAVDVAHIGTVNDYCPSCGDWSFFWNVDSPEYARHVRHHWGCEAEIYWADPHKWGYYVWPPPACNGPTFLYARSGWRNLGITIHRYAVNPPD
jgi:hypothetical protein